MLGLWLTKLWAGYKVPSDHKYPSPSLKSLNQEAGTVMPPTITPSLHMDDRIERAFLP